MQLPEADAEEVRLENYSHVLDDDAEKVYATLRFGREKARRSVSAQ